MTKFVLLENGDYHKVKEEQIALEQPVKYFTQSANSFPRRRREGSFALPLDKQWCLNLSSLAAFFVTEKKLSLLNSMFTRLT